MELEEASNYLAVNHGVEICGNNPCFQGGNMDVHVSGGDTVPII